MTPLTQKKLKQQNSMGCLFRQQGAVLLISMVFLLLLTIIATVGMKTSILELRMAGNEQTRMEYHDYAQTMIDVLKNIPATYDASLGAGVTKTLSASFSLLPTVVTETYTVASQGQYSGGGSINSVADAWGGGETQTNLLEISATVDNTGSTTTRGGYAKIANGIAWTFITGDNADIEAGLTK